MPMMGQNPADSIAVLRRLNNPTVNADAFGEILAGLRAGNRSAGDDLRSNALIDDAAGELGATPAIIGLRKAADEQRLQRSTDEQAQESDFAANGLRRAMLNAGVQNQVAGVNSEAAAARQFGPWQSQKHEQDTGDLIARTNAQYGGPALIDAESRLDVARIAAEASKQNAETQYAPSLGRILGQRFAGGHDIVDDPRGAIAKVLHRGDPPLASQSIEVLRKLLEPGQAVTLPVPRPRGY